MKRAAALLLLLAATVPAFADGARQRLPANATYRDECGSCHAPYPPGLLPAASWHRLMGDLPHHFGTDASLEAPVAGALTVWLAANANRRAAEPPPEDRITKSRWFVREHDEVPAAAWRRASVGSAANCGACHAGAAQGDYDEHAVRVPR